MKRVEKEINAILEFFKENKELLTYAKDDIEVSDSTDTYHFNFIFKRSKYNDCLNFSVIYQEQDISMKLMKFEFEDLEYQNISKTFFSVLNHIFKSFKI